MIWFSHARTALQAGNDELRAQGYTRFRNPSRAESPCGETLMNEK